MNAPSPDLARAAPLVMSPRSWALLVLLGGVWGGSFFLTHSIVREIPPVPLVTARVVLAALVLLAFAKASGLSLAPIRERAGQFALLGITNNALPFLLIATGQTAMGGGLASILNATTPLWTILVASALRREERLTVHKLSGIALGIAGVAVLVGPEALGAGHAVPLFAFAAVLAATVSYAFAASLARSFRGVPPAIVATGQLSASSLILLPILFATSGPSAYAALSAGGAASLVVLALVPTALAYILFFQIIAQAGATNASLVTFIVPASAILLGILFHGESLGLFHVAGLALILAGLAAIDGRLERHVRTRIAFR